MPKPTSQFETLTANAEAPKVRYDTLDGREHLVVPMVMAKEGVLNGSMGPLLYPAEELSNNPGRWDHKPVVVYHPTLNGRPVTACQPEILNARRVGIILNTRWLDEKLKAEAWLDVEKLNSVDQRITNMLDEQQPVEISTGLLARHELVENGEFNGTPYKAIARDYVPDHLAILPDQIGACSVKDGGGLLVNSKNPIVAGMTLNGLSHEDVRSQLQRLLYESYGKEADVWVHDVYDDAIVFNAPDGQLYRRSFSVNDRIIELGPDTDQVVRVSQYMTVTTGEVVGNASATRQKDKDMAKAQLVAALIANAALAWTDADEEALMALDEGVLEKMTPVEPKQGSQPASDPVHNAVKQGASGLNPTKEDPPKVLTVNEYVAAAPPELQQVLNDGIASLNAERQRLTSTITANSDGQWTEPELKDMEIGLLRKLASTIKPAKQAHHATANYAAAAGTTPPADITTNEEALPLPTMDAYSTAK